MSERYAVLALAHPRSGWYREVARWASTASLPLDLVVGVAGADVRARFEGGRAFSALLADATHADLDADLIALARSHGCATVVVDDGGARRDWAALGAGATLPPLFDRTTLHAVLRTHALATPDLTEGVRLDDARPSTGAARVVAVLGPGGAGASTVARAGAQGLGAHGFDVVLADLALHADQAASHDVGDVVPGLPELVEAHRHGHLDPGEVAALTWTASHLPYRLLLGLRRHGDWASLRPRATDAALASLRRSAEVVVADVDDDLDGEAETGSADVEDRNRLARLAVTSAHLVVLVVRADVRGLRRLALLTRSVLALGVDPDRIVPAVVGVPRRPGQRSRIVADVHELVHRAGAAEAQPPLMVPWRNDLARAVHDGTALPGALAEAVGRPLRVLLDRVEAHTEAPVDPAPVAPGSLGHWWPTEEVGA